MEMVNQRPLGGDSRFRLRLVLNDNRGGRHLRTIEMLRKPLPNGCRTIYRVASPKHLAGITLLVSEEQVSGIWMYFPASDHLLHVVSRGLSALTSDFSCEDLKVALPPADYEFTNLGRVQRDGKSCFRIRMRPKRDQLVRELGFSEAIGWVREDIWTIIFAEYFDAGGKRFKTFTAERIEIVDGVPTPLKYTMVNHRAQHTSEVEVLDVQYGLGLANDLFDSAKLYQIAKAGNKLDADTKSRSN